MEYIFLAEFLFYIKTFKLSLLCYTPNNQFLKEINMLKAKILPHNIQVHGETIIDNYDWLRDKNWPEVKNPEILEYLQAENQYYQDSTKQNKELEKQLYEELKARVKEDDESYPIKKGEFKYFTRLKKGQDYPILYRQSIDNNIEEMLLDCNQLALGKSSFSMGDMQVSEDHSKLAYSYDCDGSERYNIYVLDLVTDKDLADVITGAIGDIVWNNESTGFYYTSLNDNWRSDRVFFHRLGSAQKDDALIFQEDDSGFFVGVDNSASRKYLLINTGNSNSNEIHYLPLSGQEKLKIAIPRRADHLYQMDHIGEEFYLLSNDRGKNFRLVSLNEQNSFSKENFKEIISHSDNDYLTDMALYQEYLVIQKRILGLNHIEYYNIKDHKLAGKISFDEEVYEANISFTNSEDQYLRIQYSSLTMPRSVLEYDFAVKQLHTRKTEEIPSGYAAEFYEAKRLWVKSLDNVQVPISMVYRKDMLKTNNPLLLYGYGSYGLSMPVSFRPNIISLLDRGFVYVIAHIRGGDELGFTWYETAKFLHKKRTFEDFIAVAEYLIEQQYTSADKLAIMGGSAGGMLMGVAANERPDLFKAVVALVPFVDVLNTMLDDSLPLTPHEFEEWGNPIVDKEYFDYIKSYSPYDNVKKTHYPNMLVTAGLTDPRVGYWEAAKWVALLRENKLDNNLLLLKTEMDSGHRGQSGRFKGLEEIAMIYSFILNAIEWR